MWGILLHPQETDSVSKTACTQSRLHDLLSPEAFSQHSDGHEPALGILSFPEGDEWQVVGHELLQSLGDPAWQHNASAIASCTGGQCSLMYGRTEL